MPKKLSSNEKSSKQKLKKLIEIKRTIDGKRISFYGKTKKEAERNYEIAKEKSIKEEFTLQDSESEILFETWALKWLKVYKSGSVRNITYKHTYETPTINFLIPHFKNKKLKVIRQSDIKAFFNKMNNKYSYSVQNKCMLCLRSIFETAQGDHLIKENPAKSVKLSIKSSDTVRNKESLTYEQAREVIKFAKTHYAGIDIITLLKTGMRRAELIALPLVYNTESNGAFDSHIKLNGGIDIENKLIYVRQSISETEHGIDFEPCKNKESSREIPFDDELQDIFRSIQPYIFYKSSGMSYKRQYLVNGKYGENMTPANWSRRYKKFSEDFDRYAEEKGLGFHMVNPHECRFSFGSILYAKTKDIVTVSKLMGHSNIEITVRLYVDDNINEKRKAIDMGL